MSMSVSYKYSSILGLTLASLSFTGCWGRGTEPGSPGDTGTQQSSVGHQPTQGIVTTPGGTGPAEGIPSGGANTLPGATNPATTPGSGGTDPGASSGLISGYPKISSCTSLPSELIPGRDGAIVVTSTDFSTGAVGWINPRTRRVHPDLGLAHSDTRLRHNKTHNFLINRYGFDSIVIFARDAALTRQGSFSVTEPGRPSSNPHDLIIDAKGHMHLSFLGRDHLKVYDISDPANAKLTRSIDLSAFSDADGLPEAGYLIQCEDTYFVLIQRLDRDNQWLPVDHSYLVPVHAPSGALYDFDGTQDRRPDGIRILGTGMSGWRKDPRVLDGTRILALNRGLQSIDLKTAKVESVIPEQVFIDRGMDIWDVRNFAVSPDGRWVWILAIDTWPNHTIFRASLTQQGKDMIPAVQGVQSVDASMIRVDNALWLADTTDGKSGVRIFDIQGDVLEESADSPLLVGLPPYWLNLVP